MPGTYATRDLFSSVYSCASGVLVGDPVYVSAADTVAKADGTDAAKMPCIGFVFSKPTATTCIVQYDGEFITTGLTADTDYYVGASGLVTSTAGLAVVQLIGHSKSTTTLVMQQGAIQSFTGNVAITGNLTVGGNSGFYGVAAQAQPASSADARHALVTLGLIASGGDGLPNPVRFSLFDGRNPNGTDFATSPGAGVFGITCVAGTNLILVGEAAQNNTKTSVALWEFVVPFDYVAAQNLSCVVNGFHTEAGGTTLTNTVDVEAFEIADAGTQGADICATAAQALPGSAGDLTFTLTGTSLVPGDRILIRVTSVATEAGNTGTTTNTVGSVRIA